MKKIRVTCAIIFFGEKILVVQRSSSMSLPLKWEFPGGKVEMGESESKCIKREIQEELNIQIDIQKRLSSNTHIYPSSTIELIPFIANYKKGDLILKEHNQYLLLSKEQLIKLDWAEADLPILKEFLSI